MSDVYARTNNICLVFLTLVTGTAALIYMKPVLIPLIFAIFVYAILTPIVGWVERNLLLPKVVAVLFSLFGFALLLATVVLILINSVENFIEGVPKYKKSVTLALEMIETQLARFDINWEVSKIRDFIKSLPLLDWAQELTGQVLSFALNLFLVFIFTIFMMTGESRSDQKGPLMEEVLAKVSSYLSGKFFLSFMTGLFVWFVFLGFGIELAFIFALLTVLLNFIPTIGSIVAVILPLPVIFLQHQFGWPFWVILSLTGVIQFMIGNVIEPKMLGDSMDLHPISVLICLIFWGMVWGAAGMFLAVPITAVIKIIFSRVEATQTFAEVLAGRMPDR